MEIEYKEVNFEEYCKKCKYGNQPEHYDPCNECLDHPMNLQTSNPVNYIRKEEK